MKNEEVFSVELDSAFQKKLIKAIIKIGEKNNAHPVQFVLALIQAAKIITEVENLQLDNLLSVLNDNEEDASLH